MTWRRRQGLATATTKDGDQLFGTRDALLLPGREIPWEAILSAEWDSDGDTLTVMLVEPEMLTFELDDPALLVQLVRERVTASIVLTRRIPVGDLGFTLMARRPPSGGEISFTFEYDRALDPDSPTVQQAARNALRGARDDLGV